jgi:hypothetical protein
LIFALVNFIHFPGVEILLTVPVRPCSGKTRFFLP